MVPPFEEVASPYRVASPYGVGHHWGVVCPWGVVHPTCEGAVSLAQPQARGADIGDPSVA